MNKKRSFALFGAMVLAGSMLGCSSSSGDEASGEESITLGYTATLSGDFASYGLEMREGIDLAIEEINASGGALGKQLKIDSVDDEGKPGNGPVIAQQFCDDSAISGVLGYSFSSVALSALPIYTQCGLPVLASAVTSPELSGASEIFFRNVFTDAYQGAEGARFISEERGVENIAVLYQQDDYGQGVADAFETGFEKAGGTITSSQAYQLGTVNFGSTVGAALKTKPDAIFIAGFYTEAAKIVTQIRDSGSDLPLFASDGAASPLLIELGGENVEGLELYSAFSASDDSEGAKAFTAAYTEKYSKEPTSWAALAYDATFVMADALERAGNADRAALTEALASTEEFGGVSGTISFDEDGNRVGNLVFQRIEDGKFVVITE